MIYVADKSVAEFVLKEVKNTREMKELWAQKGLRSEKPITFLWDESDCEQHGRQTVLVYRDDTGVADLVKCQLISKCPFGVIVWTKIPTKKFPRFLP